jgi:FAD dependent oxidoreductase
MSEPDVLVYGATGAGVMAAVAAAGAGATVRLVDPGRHVGGMVSGGLSWTDVGRLEAVGGLTGRFYERVAEHYGVGLFEVPGPEPHVAEDLLTTMLAEAGVEVVLEERLTGADTAGDRIRAVLTSSGRHPAGVFVDAGYEGDLLASAGVPYRVGRESRALYGEIWAGRQPAYRPSRHNFSVILSPFETEDTGGLLPFIRPPELDRHGWPAERLGEGDEGLQAYGFRLCMTDRAANGRPLEEPKGYDPARFELLRRYLAAEQGHASAAGWLLGLRRNLLPGGKCDVNSVGPFSLNLLDGSNRDYPEGDERTRARIRDRHLAYSHELLYYLQNDDGVPAWIRDELRGWFLCADEFDDTDGWPHQLYVRDGRRMVGETVLTEHDLLNRVRQPDMIALGSYNIDIREIERTWRFLPEYRSNGDAAASTAGPVSRPGLPAVFNEGYVSVGIEPYAIPYRALVPSADDCANLLVPVCLSASHVAFASVRTEPTLMALGQAAGVAAALAAIGGTSVQRIDVPRLQRRLATDGQPL